MSEIVKLPKGVAEALDKSMHMGPAAIMSHIVRFDGPESMKTTMELTLIHSFYKKNPYLIASALVNGYEVDMTPEDKVRKFYELELIAHHEDKGNEGCATFAIRKTLDLLNIKIPGVNAE